MKNENKIYFHPLNNKTRRSPKSGIKTPNGNKMRKPGKHNNQRIRPEFRKTMKTSKVDTKYINMIPK